MLQRSVIFVSLAALVALISWATVSTGVPKIYAPFSLFVFFPLMLVANWLDPEHFGFLGTFVPPLLFCFWALPRAWTDRPLPMRSLVLLVLAVGSSAALLGFYSYLGKQYQGSNYVFGVWVLNLACWIALGALAFLARRRASHQLNLGFHTALFAWLSWCAFPYLGEL